MFAREAALLGGQARVPAWRQHSGPNIFPPPLFQDQEIRLLVGHQLLELRLLLHSALEPFDPLFLGYALFLPRPMLVWRTDFRLSADGFHALASGRLSRRLA
jgi:hypothetical protein